MIDMDMRYCRKIFGSWLHQSGIASENIDFLQGRVSPSVFGRHYLTPSNDLKDRVLDGVDKLQREINKSHGMKMKEEKEKEDGIFNLTQIQL
jgi:Archaeal phage integrase